MIGVWLAQLFHHGGWRLSFHVASPGVEIRCEKTGTGRRRRSPLSALDALPVATWPRSCGRAASSLSPEATKWRTREQKNMTARKLPRASCYGSMRNKNPSSERAIYRSYKHTSCCPFVHIPNNGGTHLWYGPFSHRKRKCVHTRLFSQKAPQSPRGPTKSKLVFLLPVPRGNTRQDFCVSCLCV